MPFNPWTGLGNINLFTRPITRNPDGSQSSLYSTSFQDEPDGPEILVPGVDRTGKGIFRNPDGSFDEPAAKNQYHKTGEFLAKFIGPNKFAESDTYAQQLHKDAEAGLYTPPLASSRKDVDPKLLRKTLLFLLTRQR